MNEIKTETQWGNNIIVNVNIIVSENATEILNETFIDKLKRKIFNGIFGSEHGAEMWNTYEKKALISDNVFGKSSEKKTIKF